MVEMLSSPIVLTYETARRCVYTLPECVQIYPEHLLKWLKMCSKHV